MKIYLRLGKLSHLHTAEESALVPADVRQQRLNEALHAVQHGLLTLRQAQRIYNIPKSTLHRRLYTLRKRQKAR